MKNLLEITGNVRERYILAATLLQRLDHVRDEPTTYGLDQNLQGLEGPQNILMRKFLDSFALICAIRKGGDFVAAACLEHDDEQEKTVIRIASNTGVLTSTLNQLQDIVGVLKSFAFDSTNQAMEDVETDVLSKITKLDISRIRDYAKQLKKSNQVPQETAIDLAYRLRQAWPHETEESVLGFVNWFAQITSITKFEDIPESDKVMTWINWAQQARNTHRILFQAAFSRTGGTMPRWATLVFKIGRYGIAARVFLKVASSFPKLFSNITIEAISAPDPVAFEPRINSSPLDLVLRRVPGVIPEAVISRLAILWETPDPERSFHQACTKELVAHAELQLVNFYDDNPHLKLLLTFIGVSKKSCFLCDRYLKEHHGGFTVSSCHQKLYLSIPPPVTDNNAYTRLRTMVTSLCAKMELSARDDLKDRFGVKRKFVPADSTNGVSYTGLSMVGFSQPDALTIITEVDGESENADEMGVLLEDPGDSFSKLEISSETESSGPTTPKPSEWMKVDLSQEDALGSQRELFTPRLLNSIGSIVLHFRMEDDEMREDIIKVESILDPVSRRTPWSMLLDILRPVNEYGIVFRDSDHLLVKLVKNKFRVRDARQFDACLQYLMNAGTLNAEVVVCDGRSTSSIYSS